MHRKVEIRHIKEISPHEEHNPRHLTKLLKTVLHDRHLKKPILIDRETGMIIDGTHRYHILRTIGAEAVPVIEIDYLAENITIAPWYRIYRSIDTRGVETREGESTNRPIIKTREATLTIIKPEDPPEAVRRIDRNNLDRLIAYTPTPQAPNGYTYLIYPPPTKEEVLERHRRNYLYPPKYTRHIHTIKPTEINIPLDTLLEPRKAERHIKNIINPI